MQIIKLPQNIKNIVDFRDTEHLVVETGKENIFFETENKLVVKKAFLKNITKVFLKCSKLKTIDFSNFDFSEITTMQSWFSGCEQLESIIFPKNMNCKNLTNLTKTFQETGITHMDLSRWGFNTQVPILMEDTFSCCNNLEQIILPNVIFDNIMGIASDCFNLKSVTFLGGEFTEMCINNSLDSFSGCEQIELIDMSKFRTLYLEGLKRFFNSTLTGTLYMSNNEVVIILPNK